ncbi:MAG: PaaI family thioesterase [Chloroflexota bacterium]
MDNSAVQPGGTPDNVAELKARARAEPIAALLKMELVELSPGYARVQMKPAPEHLNFNGFVFGGIVMALADQAFAYGVNSISRPSVATQFNMHFIAPAEVGDTLTAECRVVRSGRRVGISEMTVTNLQGKLIAKATGTTIPLG